MTDIITAIVYSISPAALPIVVCVLGCILWCYFIYLRIDRDLHEKLLKIDSSEVLPFIQLLPLISSVYFRMAIEILQGLTAETKSLSEVKEWLIASLSEARDV